MYKSKFATRKEAYDYTMGMLPKAKQKGKVLTNYSNALQALPCGNVNFQMIPEVEPVYYRAFDYTTGNVPTDTLVIREGVIDI